MIMTKINEKIKMRFLNWMGSYSYRNLWFPHQQEVTSKQEALKIVGELKYQYPKAVKEFEYREFGDRVFFELLKREGL